MTRAVIVDETRLISMLADGMSIASCARELSIAYATAWERAQLPAIKEGVQREVEARREIVARQRDAGAVRVLTRAIEAAEGKWEPTGAQLELIRYFIGWNPDAPAQPPQAAAQAIVVNLPSDWRPPTPTVEE
jgi:hypothetical protein